MVDTVLSSESSARGKWPWFSIVLLLAGGGMLFQYGGNAPIVIVTLAAASILLIIFGERFALDDILESSGIPGRDAIIPVFALCIALCMGAVSPLTLQHEFSGKIGIILLILSFALLAEGIARSGYFAFAAYKIVSKCRGNTTRLIVYMYILTSLLAFLTSNDIVILVLTPVILSICVHARIQNTRLLLLSQFVAANTMSMGTLIGSPTNIIFGYALNISFFHYLFMMILPAFLCGALSLIVIDWINRQSRPGTKGMFAKRWAYEETYRIPATARYVNFTQPMKTWLILFGLAVTLLAVVSSLHESLLYAATPIALVTLYYLYRGKLTEMNHAAQARQDTLQVIRFLPYSIFFFGMTFFTFSAELVHMHVVTDIIMPFVRAHVLNDIVHASFGMLIISGGLVNTINDLPAAAFLSDILQHIGAHGGPLNDYMQLVVEQAILVGLNIGCYVTPIGALAGLMWFNIIRKEERRQQGKDSGPAPIKSPAGKMLTPTRGDLVGYGLMHFAFVSFVLGYVLPFFVHIIDILVSSPSLANETALPGLLSIRQYLPYIGIGLLAFTILSVRSILVRSGVLLGHLREVFAVLTRVTIWTMKNRLLYLILLGSTLLTLASSLLYWAETTHERIYGLGEGSKPLFDSLSSFFIWAMVFSGAGLSDAYKPHSALGMALTSILPVLVIGGIVLIAQLSTDKTINQLARRMANGDIPGYRIVIINFHNSFEKFVETMLYNRAATILLLCNPQNHDRAVSFCARLDQKPWSAYRSYAALKHADASYSMEEFHIDQADEIYILSDMTVLGEYDKIRYVTKLDAAVNAIRKASTEGLDEIMHSAAAENGSAHEVEGIPKIFIETCSERFHGLMQKTSSPLFLHSSIQTTFDRDISDLLMSDIDESMALLNRYYQLGRPAMLPYLFKDNQSPLSDFVFKDYALDDEGRKLFQEHFSGPDIDSDDASLLLQDAASQQHSSTAVRANVGRNTQGAQYYDGKTFKPLNTVELYGVVADMAGCLMHLSIPSAALSMQKVNVEKVVLKQPALTPVGSEQGVLGNIHYRIFIFNLSQLAKTYVRQLLALFSQEKQPRVILLCSATQFVPEDIKAHPCVRLIQSAHIEDIVQQICPLLEEWSAQDTDGFIPRLQKGDRLYGFLEHDSANVEASSIDFIDQLDTRLRQLQYDATIKGVPAPITHPEVYIAMEVLGTESRLTLENFYIDKIIDTSMTRINYLETLATLFHRILADKSVGSDMEASVSNFRRAAEIASYLCHYTVAIAEDVRLKDDSGSEISVVGKSFTEIVPQMRAYSNPPVQLFCRVRMESVAHETRKFGSRTFRLVKIPEHESIRKGDLLLNIAVI